MSVVMKNRQKQVRRVLQFPAPTEEPASSRIVVQIGKERFAIHWEIEEMAPAVPPVLLTRPVKKVKPEIIR
jgi:hypothetical protein